MGRETLKNIKKCSIFKNLTKEEYYILNSYTIIVEDVLKLTKRQKMHVSKSIRDLFHELTNERVERKQDYLSDPNHISAYIYYYLWWNLYRMVRLFNSLSIDLRDGDVIGDFGAGPFAFIMALWIAKPHLRDRNLSFYCVDISAKAMKIGEDLFYSLCAFTKKEKYNTNNILYKQNIRWKIKRVVGGFGISINEKLDFFVCANMFNELCWKRFENIKNDTKKYSNLIANYTKKNASILIIEPGIPVGGNIVASFREAFLEKSFSILSPCPHEGLCNIHAKSSIKPTARGKWCHFLLKTFDAPLNLLKTSENVHLAKTTASLSYIYCSKKRKMNAPLTKENKIIKVLITSNVIRLPNGKIGNYACSELGFLILIQNNNEDSKKIPLSSGTYITINASKINISNRDRKSGAILLDLCLA